MKIEVGKTYKRRLGDTVKCVVDDGSDFAPLACESRNGRHWHRRDGRSITDMDMFDIVAEVSTDGTVTFDQPPAAGVSVAVGAEIAPELRGRVDLKRYGVSPADDAMQQRLADPAPVKRPQTASGIASELDAAQQRQRTEQRMLDTDRAIRSLRRSAICQAAATVLLAIALLCSNAANARDLLWMPNDAGGEIVLTDEIAPDCADARVVFARAAGGRTFVGCYAYTESGYIAARFGTDIRTWRLEDFRLFETAPARGTRL